MMPKRRSVTSGPAPAAAPEAAALLVCWPSGSLLSPLQAPTSDAAPTPSPASTRKRRRLVRLEIACLVRFADFMNADLCLRAQAARTRVAALQEHCQRAATARRAVSGPHFAVGQRTRHRRERSGASAAATAVR